MANTPENRYYICSELKRVSICHESVGFVESGLVMLPSTTIRVVRAGVDDGKQAELS